MEHWEDYSTVRLSIKTGDLYYTTGKNLYDRVIHLVSDSDISHVGVFIWVGDRLFTIECVPRGCIMMLASERLRNASVIIQTTGLVPDMDIALDSVGKIEYDWVGVLLSPFYRLKRTKEYCVEFIESIFSIQIGPVDRNVYPSDCYEYFEERKNKSTLA